MIKNSTTSLGMQAEKLACHYLKDKKFKILEQNFKCRLGEIDIICQEGKTLVFVEVKSRRTTAFGLPVEAVHLQKQKRIINAARFYLTSRRLSLSDTHVRFDVVGIHYQNKTPFIQHIPGAFLSGEA